MKRKRNKNHVKKNIRICMKRIDSLFPRIRFTCWHFHVFLCVCVCVRTNNWMYSLSNVHIAFHKICAFICTPPLVYSFILFAYLKIKSPGYSCARPDCLRGHVKICVSKMKSKYVYK